MNHFLIFGSHPLLSLAEAKAVIGGDRPVVEDRMAIFETDSWNGMELQERLAGTVKLGDVAAELSVRGLTAEKLADEIEAKPRNKKIEFGLTIYGGSPVQREKTKKLPLQLKRVLQERGHSVRWVTGEKGEVTSAAVSKAELTTKGYDFCIAFIEDRAVVGLTTNVQNMDAWSQRDFGRPFRDTETGMLPPKLARMMVNLAVGSSGENTLLDPFCGGGTVLMEAGLLGVKKAIGSDFDARQIDGTKKNLEWLAKEKILEEKKRKTIKLFVQPAEAIDRALKGELIDAIVTEGYLGRPLTGDETLPTLKQHKYEIEDLWQKALASFAKIQKRGGTIVCSWPVFVSSHGTVAVDLLEDVGRHGYRAVDPLEEWIDNPVTLTYARPEQRVKRNIIVLERL